MSGEGPSAPLPGPASAPAPTPAPASAVLVAPRCVPADVYKFFRQGSYNRGKSSVAAVKGGATES